MEFWKTSNKYTVSQDERSHKELNTISSFIQQMEILESYNTYNNTYYVGPHCINLSK